MELVDLYNFKREKIGNTWPRKEPLPENTYRGTIHICIFNSNNQMMIQKRTATKKVFPNLWDISIGGGVSAGDDIQKTATKELFEELGIVHDFSNERPYLTVHFSHGFDDIFTFVQDIDLKTLTLQKTEVTDVKWATEEEIIQMIDNKEFIPYEKKYIPVLFTFVKRRGIINE